ncbi:MAG: MIP/aquaporin family protein [Planctomycetota bacterium]
MQAFLGELVGTALLLLLGNGVVANVVLPKSKGSDSGWIVITLGWGMAVFVAVWCSAAMSGAHLNPAVTVGLAVAERLDWSLVPTYVGAQMLGAFLGAVLVWLVYRDHYAACDDGNAILATFSTSPAIRRVSSNVVCEAIGTFVLVYAVLSVAEPAFEMAGMGQETPRLGLGTLGALPVGLLVLGIGLSLGGPTGYAINPARDLGPRVAHACLPIAAKRDGDWSYAWIPVVGPCLGAIAAAGLHLAIGGG